MKTLLNAMLVEELTDTSFGVYNGIGIEDKYNDHEAHIECKIGDNIYWLPVSGTLKKKDFPELQKLFNTEIYGDKKQVTEKPLIDKIIKSL